MLCAPTVCTCPCSGTTFDSSYARGTPFKFHLGQGEVIRGWDVGIGSMRVGEAAILQIPSGYAYGDAAVGAYINPHADLTFAVELLEVRNDEYDNIKWQVLFLILVLAAFAVMVPFIHQPIRSKPH